MYEVDHLCSNKVAFLIRILLIISNISGRMRFGQIDATEAQVTMMLVMVVTAMAGTGFWGIKVSVLSTGIKDTGCY